MRPSDTPFGIAPPRPGDFSAAIGNPNGTVFEDDALRVDQMLLASRKNKVDRKHNALSDRSVRLEGYAEEIDIEVGFTTP